jgi:hypothetical protein
MKESCLARPHGDMRLGKAETHLAESETPVVSVIETQRHCADGFLCRYEGGELQVFA